MASPTPPATTVTIRTPRLGGLLAGLLTVVALLALGVTAAPALLALA
ncbi:hypothetical protein KSP35_20900 [Aquihabitans sp. G128]|nr:hypothetical protein [Aquihabitans sp. G128]QXC60751.1 hypothetical protein KSP35_20900 [Aquihabitans sp. G128]